MDLSNTVLAFAEPLTITRRAAPTLDTATGRYTSGATSTVTVKACIQPVSGEELLTLRELQETNDILRLYSPSLLRVGSETDGTLADEFTYKGQTYEIRQITRWETLGNFYIYTAAAK